MRQQKQKQESSSPDISRENIEGLLSTKLNPPLIRSNIVDRPQLLTKLEKDILRPLTVISAPAGYGKSTLAAQWLETGSLPGVWVSLGEGENNVRTFLAYVVAAVRRIEPKACQHIHDLLDVAQFPPSDILVNILANDLEEIRRPFLLVLDDYHLVTHPDIHDLLNRLLQHSPGSLHLVIVTRYDPPFSLVTMKSRGLAVEIRESNLQFNATEVGRLLEQAGGIRLDEEGMAQIMDETEGWVTGLHLFCLALEKGPDFKAHLAAMGGGGIHMQDYLVEQVLSHQTPEMKEWLLKSSILDRFCTSLCEAVCNDSPGKKNGKRTMNGRKFIETVNHANLFGVQLDAGGEWIRYHHLFQDLLRSQLQRKSDQQNLADLHRRAAQWFGYQGLIEEGLKHARAAGDSELAADIIEDNRSEMMKMDKWQRLGKYLDSLPFAVENSRPHLLMSRAYVFMYSARVEEIPAIMDKVVVLEGESPSDPILAGELHFFRGMVDFFMGEVASCQRHFDVVLATATNLECRAESELHSFVALHLDGKQELAVNGLRTAIQRNEPRSLFYLTRWMFGLSLVQSLAGLWPASSQAAERLEKLSRKNDLAWAAAWGANMRGNATLQMLDLEVAERSFSQVFEMRYILNPRAVTEALVGLALSRQLQGREAEADQSLREASEFARWTGTAAYLDVVDSGRSRIDLLRGDQDAATRWLAAFQGKPDGTVKVYFREYPEITACRVMVAWGTPESLDKAAFQLERQEEESRRFHLDCHLVPILVIKSLLHEKRGERDKALEVLAEAVDLAWPGRWILPFIEGGAPVAKLLRQLPESPEWGGFVPRILARFDFDPATEQTVTQQPRRRKTDAPIVDLTNRETDVIVLLCDRLYDKEIADRLGISPATVKTHLTHVYSKLGVANRREAARKAKQLGLV